MNYKSLFCQDNPAVTYLNCATMSPLAVPVQEAGINGIRVRSLPHLIGQDDFFKTAEEVKMLFATLINVAEPERIAIMPSVSYGVASVVKTLIKKKHCSSGNKILLVGDEFPSDVYGWKPLSEASGANIITIRPPEILNKRGEIWNQRLIDAIDTNTDVVCLSPCHWADGTKFDLKSISLQCEKFGALLIVDGTQFIGAYPFDLNDIKVDCLICSVYKWLLGPYGNTLAYMSPYFDDGDPIEETWIGRVDSNDFKNLVNYKEEYRPQAFRYTMGGFSNFINMPMMVAALKLVLELGPNNIQNNAKKLSTQLLSLLDTDRFWVEEDQYRYDHLFGLKVIDERGIDYYKAQLMAAGIHVSYRSNFIRISIHMWNDEEEITKLRNVLNG